MVLHQTRKKKAFPLAGVETVKVELYSQENSQERFLHFRDNSVELCAKSRLSCLSKDKAECFSVDRMPASSNLSPC